MPRQSVLAGHIAPVFESLFLSRDDFRTVFHHVYAILHAKDLAVLVAFGWLLVPSARMIYERSFANNADAAATKRSKSLDKEGEDNEGMKIGGYEGSWFSFAVDSLSQMFRLAMLVYACDCVVVAFKALGYEAESASISLGFAKVVYASWLTRRAQRFKRPLVRRMLPDAPENGDKINLINWIVDWILLSVLFIKVMEFLSVETGLALGSIFAIGTTGGLIVSLASQEIAKGVVTGIEMASSTRFYVGDNVHFGDGTKGTITKMGFLRTKVRKYDSSVVDIPNAQLGGQRLVNISRTHVCRVVTTIRFEYEDIQKIPNAMALVKEEMIEACPKLIREGKPFRAMISSFEKGYVEATINCSFQMPPSGEEYWVNREQMFLAIDRGVRKSDIRYANPLLPFLESDS